MYTVGSGDYHHPRAGAYPHPRTGYLSHPVYLSCAHHRSTFLASLPWFLQDIATCGLGIILQAIRLPEPRIEQKLLHELAVALYAEDLLSLGKARELAQRTSTSLASFLPSGTSWGITGTMN